MELWHAWTGLLQQILQMLATDCGLGAGLAIVVLTLAMRAALLPVSWTIAFRAATRQAKLAMLAAVTTAVAMAVAPNMPEQMRLLLILLPAVFCLLAALHLSSGISLYWITTNTFGAAQTIALRRVVKRRGGE